MKQGHVPFHFMCKLYVGPKGMQSDYTVYSPISISMEKEISSWFSARYGNEAAFSQRAT